MSLPITISARIRDENGVYTALDEVAKKWGYLERRLFVEKHSKGAIDRDAINKLKRDWLIEHNLSSMQFNALDRQLGGKIAALKVCVKLAKNSIETKIKKVENDLKDEAKKKTPNLEIIHQKKRRQYNLVQKLRKLTDRKETSLCFGSRKLFREQFHLKENGYADHAEWKAAWEHSRNNQFLCLGNAASLGGNSACQLTDIVETPKSLRGKMTVRPFAGLPAISFPIEFTYNTEHLSAALKAKGAITYRLFREHKKWHVYATLNRVEVKVVTSQSNGFLGADMNATHLACAGINKDGNLTTVFDLDFRFEPGESSNRRKYRIQKVVIALVEKARVAGTPIVIEKLDFSKKKKELKSRGYNRMLSSFAYSSFNAQLHSRAQKCGVEIIEVNPAYSSHIGYHKFAKGMGLPIHQGAALAIARRGGTTFSKHVSFKEDPKGNPIYVPHTRFSERLRAHPSRSTLPAPVRMRGSHVWQDWRKLPSISRCSGNPSPSLGKAGRGAKSPVDAWDPIKDVIPGLEAGTTPVSGSTASNLIVSNPKSGKLSARLAHRHNSGVGSVAFGNNRESTRSISEKITR